MNLPLKRGNVFIHLFQRYTRIDVNIKRCVRIKPQIVDMPPSFYLNIEQKLNKINYYDNPQRLIDIGFGDDSKIKSRLLSLEKEIASKHVRDDASDDEEMNREIDYNIAHRKWLFSEYGIKSIIDLAHHYAIFRDLFPSPPSEDDPKPVRFFTPFVPIHCEFCIKQSQCQNEDNNKDVKDNDNEEVIVSSVYRGNIIMPNYCIHAPNVIIDSSAINGHDNISSDDGTLIANHMQNIYDDKSCAGIKLLSDDDKSFYTLALINLDTHFGEESSVCHWLVSNIHNNNGVTKYNVSMDYLPVYGIRGLGYHRFVFVLFEHQKPLIMESEPIKDNDLKNRKFDAFQFISNHESNCKVTPVGLSWFQTSWDYTCQKIFFEKLDMRSPVYEWIFPKKPYRKQQQFPSHMPFNIYLDFYRDPKEIAKSVLTERLASVHPYQYQDTFKDNNIPSNIYKIAKSVPSWVKADIRKRRNKLGIFRGLRPHSALRPLNNNLDLDNPIMPNLSYERSPLNMPLPYPDGKRRPKRLKDTLWVKPPHEHSTFRIESKHGLSETDKEKLKITNDS